MKLDQTLKKLINDSGHNVSEIARKVDVSAKTLHNWLVGQPPRDLRQVKKVANYFDVTLDYLCFGETSEGSISKYNEEINAGVFEVVLRRVKG